MNLQDLVDTYLDILRSFEKTMRIGQALEELEKLPKNAEVKISMEWQQPYYDNKQMYFDKTYGSDRGDYAKMYLGFTFEETITTVQDLIDLLLNAKKEGEMIGYKGGVFKINDDTLLTIAEYGYSKGIQPTYFELKDNIVIMHTTYAD